MDNRPSLSRGETQVLKALWRLDKGSVGEIHAAVPEELEMDYSTVQTYVRRLLAKGYVSAQRIGRNKIYRPAVRKSQVIGEAVEDFLDHMFDGKLLPMVRHLVDSRDVSPEEIQDLMKIVERLHREKGSDDEQ
jgi:predicted transcriptional regulator